MDETRALEILNVKAGVYHRLKAERKREEVRNLRSGIQDMSRSIQIIIFLT